MLKSTDESLHDEVQAAAFHWFSAYGNFDRVQMDVFFEHGQWWVRLEDMAKDADEEGATITYSVVDAYGSGSIDGFGFEEV